MADGLLDRIGRTLRTAGSGIGDILAAGGQAYAPPDMNLTRNQQMGLLGSRLGDMMVGPRGERTNNTPTYLQDIRNNQTRLDVTAAIQADPDLTPAEKQSLLSLPTSNQIEFMQNKMETKYAPSGLLQAPSSVREFNFYQKLTPDEQAIFERLKRQNPYLNTGASLLQPNPLNPAGDPLAEIPITYGPGESPADRADIVSAEEEARTGLSEPLTPAQSAIDQAFATQYAEYELGGDRQSAERNLIVLEDAMKELQGTLDAETQGQIMGFDPELNPELVLQNDINYSGAIAGSAPDVLRQTYNPEAVDLRQRIEGIVQQGLRLTLGAQFTEREGERLIERAYNQRQEEDVNLRRLLPLFALFKAGINERNRQADYYTQNGTLQGFEPGRGLQLTIDDFYDAVDRAESGEGMRLESLGLTQAQIDLIEAGQLPTDLSDYQLDQLELMEL